MFIYLYDYFNYMGVCAPCVCLQRTGVTDRCEPRCGCWKSNSGLLQKQCTLLTMEPSLKPL